MTDLQAIHYYEMAKEKANQLNMLIERSSERLLLKRFDGSNEGIFTNTEGSGKDEY